LVKIGSTNYITLAAWQATGKDINSITEMPNFISPDLHIDFNIYTLLDGHATPITGITTDIDNEPQNISTPDIGADEFLYVPVELTSFLVKSNGNEVVINWSTATETNNSGFSIERKTYNTEYSEIGFVLGFGTTTEPKSYSYTDLKVSTGIYKYRLKQIDFDGSYEYSSEVEIEVSIPLEITLEQNYPYPFNPNTVISFQLPVNGEVILNVYDILGNKVATLVNEFKPAGSYEVEFNASTLSSGVYFY